MSLPHVTAAHTGTQINVCPGTYDGNVTIPSRDANISIVSVQPHAAVIYGTTGALVDDSAADVSLTGLEILGPTGVSGNATDVGSRSRRMRRPWLTIS